MIRRKGLGLLIIFLLLAVLAVGVGFSLFYFGNNTTSAVQPSVSVSVDDLQIGKVSIDGAEQTYQLFLDIDKLYLISSANPTKEAEFPLNLSGYEGYQVSLVCDVVLSDTDARGIGSVDYQVTDEERMEHHDISNSILDYFEPASIGNAVFQVTQKTENKISYRCVLIENVTNESNMNVKVGFQYKTDQGLDMSPNSQCTTKQGFVTVMHYMKKAMENSAVSVTFRLILADKEGTT